jgi:Zn-dependent peptidase ImmA (M78 family)
VALDLVTLGEKIRLYRELRGLETAEVTSATGISEERLLVLERGEVTPTGDEVLIIADFFQCDYRFFVSNQRLAPFQQIETLYRRFGDEFSKDDRLRIQEFLFLCECEAFLVSELGWKTEPFRFAPSGTLYKAHGEQAARALRRHFFYAANVVPNDVYADFRRIGFHVLRRRLDNSNISGLTIHHPVAGTCILVNYSEDIYRQRFTAAHEAGHGILDFGEEVIVSFTNRYANNLTEVRANTFAAKYLLPTEIVSNLPVGRWTRAEIVKWASHFRVSTAALAIALKEVGKIDDNQVQELRRVSVPSMVKVDPELGNLEGRAALRKSELLWRGLSTFYVRLCFDAYSVGLMTARRLAEMMLVEDIELNEIASLFNVQLLTQ